MLHSIRIRIIFGWTRADSALEKCKNCLIRDEMGKRSLAANCSWVKYTTPSPSPKVDSTGKCRNRKFNIDIAKNLEIRPQLLHGQRRSDAACRRRISARPSPTPSLTSGRLFLTSRHTASRQQQKDRGKGS